MSENKNRYPEILKDLKESVVKSLTAQGVELSVANQSAHVAAESIRRDWGGILVYICKGSGYDLSLRDEKIWSEFTGHNHQELCKKYDITIQRVYKIIAVKRQQDLMDRQNDLFG